MLPSSLNQPYVRHQLIVEFEAAAAPATTQVLILDEVPLQIGTNLQLFCWVTATDALVPDDVSSTIIDQSFRMIAAGLATVPANRLSKTAAGGAGTFAADVDFVAVWNGVTGTAGLQLALVAVNAAGAVRTGNLNVTWWTSRGAFR